MQPTDFGDYAFIRNKILKGDCYIKVEAFKDAALFDERINTQICLIDRQTLEDLRNILIFDNGTYRSKYL